MAGLASLFTGGGLGGYSNSSGVTASTPFYNESGIYFDSPNAGAISDSGSTASSVPKSQQNSSNAIADSLLPNGDFSTRSSSNLVYYIIGAIVALVLVGYLAFKK